MVRFKHALWCCPRNSGPIITIVCVIAALLMPPNVRAGEGDIPLHLEVFINDQPTGLIGAFTMDRDHRLSVMPGELNDLGIKLPANQPRDQAVFLDRMTGVRYSYDEASQSLHLFTADNLRLARIYDAGGKQPQIPAAKSDWGSVLNYTAYGSATDTIDHQILNIGGLSLSLDGWVYSPYGVLSSSALATTTDFSKASLRRLDTNWSYSDPDSLRTYVVGDLISSGLSWTRPIRMGGIQIRRDFDLRPDLITMPLPSLRGSAAVPSSVDVYVNNVKVFTQDVPAGPFQLQNIPTIGSNGQANLVVRDASGREQQSTADFFTSPLLLRKGLYDYSLEAGFARRDFGSGIDSYDSTPGAAASLRYGLSDKVTTEAHAEVAPKLVNAGVGVNFVLGHNTLVTTAVSGSLNGKLRGAQFYAAFDTELAGFSLSASSQRTLGNYRDLAAISGKTQAFDTSALISSADPPKAIDRVSLGLPLPSLAAGMNLSLINIESAKAKASRILSLSYNQQIFGSGSFFATAFVDFNRLATPSVFAGFSFPLGRRGNTNVGVTKDAQGTTVTTSYARSMEAGPGSYGWRVYDNEGERQRRGAELTYRSNFALSQVSADQVGNDVAVSGYVDGGVALTTSGIFLSNRIDDSFAIVDVGAPNVEVYAANRLVGRTNADGKLLVPGLLAYDRNKLTIGTEHLPLNASVPVTSEIVVPAHRSGVNVKFGVETNTASAIVILIDENGKPLQAGTQGKLQGNGQAFVVGYDGRAYIEHLKSDNVVTVDAPAGPCSASFSFVPRDNAQIEIGPLTCKH